MRPLIPLITLLSILLSQSLAHKCVLRDSPNHPPATLPDSRINDDYCDCLDASDENRTAACPNGLFICQNSAYKKRTIPASWVRDGSCDCCDGSDEAPGQCPDSCAILRERDLKHAKVVADSVLRGVATRERYVKLVVPAIEKDARELRKLQRELVTVETALGRSSDSVEALRRRRDLQQRLPVVERGTPLSKARNEESSGAERQVIDDDDDYDYTGSDGDEVEEAKESGNSDSQKHVEDDADGEEHRDDLHDEHLDDEQFDDDEDYDDEDEEEQIMDDKIDDHLADDEEEEAVSSSSKTEKEANTKQEHGTRSGSDEGSEASTAASETENEPHVAPEPALNVDSVCADLETSSSNRIFRMISYARVVLLAKLHRIFPKLFPVRAGSAISGLDECIRQADSAKWKLESQKNDIEAKIKKLEKKKSYDYGADQALRKLHGECTKSKVMQYEFEHCPFDLVRQYEHGSPIATLGRFHGWEVDGDERHMKYSNGDTCWNGPARSIKVQLLCGEKEEIVSVDEPNRCTYFMKFRTPAVCEKALADKIMSAFNTDSEEKEEL